MNDKSKSEIEGEGSYTGAKTYDDATTKFVKDGKVDKAANEAKRAVDSAEAADLKAAEAKGKAGDPRGMNKR
jgi:hypothetical protein